MKIVSKVTYSNGDTAEAVAGPADIVAFERHYATSFMGFGGPTSRAEHVFWLAWAPLHRTGKEVRSFDEFLTVVADVEGEDDGEEVVPFDPGQSAGSSQASPPTPE